MRASRSQCFCSRRFNTIYIHRDIPFVYSLYIMKQMAIASWEKPDSHLILYNCTFIQNNTNKHNMNNKFVERIY